MAVQLELGITMASEKAPMSVKRVRKFWSAVDKNGPTMPHMRTQCWVWTRGKLQRGYGLFRANGKHAQAHRLSYLLEVGPIPEGLCVLHHCDNPPCVRPDHLFIGTGTDNAIDMALKGRQASKLSRSQVLRIRARYAKGGITTRKLAAKYGVSGTIISWLLQGYTWRTVGGPRSHGEEGRPNAKLKRHQVLEIRARRAAGERAILLAREYGVTLRTVHRAVSRITWKDI